MLSANAHTRVFEVTILRMHINEDMQGSKMDDLVKIDGDWWRRWKSKFVGGRLSEAVLNIPFESVCNFNNRLTFSFHWLFQKGSICPKLSDVVSSVIESETNATWLYRHKLLVDYWIECCYWQLRKNFWAHSHVYNVHVNHVMVSVRKWNWGKHWLNSLFRSK